jgi:uncharacterized protein YbbC (DUF1343 family)
MAIEIIITAIPMAMPATAMRTMGLEKEVSSDLVPLSILLAIKDSKFKKSLHLLMTRKSRNLMMCLMALLLSGAGCAQPEVNVQKDLLVVSTLKEQVKIAVGAENTRAITGVCRDKTVVVVTNQTGMIQQTHLVDSLLALGVNIKSVFAPEHGFRGDVPDGEHIADGKDPKTGLPLVSLYGKNKKPTSEQMKGVDVVIFDIQDVGARFYTYISTLHYVMEAAAESGAMVLLLDRPNPNGHYVDGPVLKNGFESFVGMHPVAMVHGMTVGEYAQMINGEGWLAGGKKCRLTVIPCEGYNHNVRYILPVRPSPNLPNMTSIYLYPSLALFEGTEVSVGRGTEKPFQQIGMPGFTKGNHSFTPVSIVGASVNPPHKDKLCSGFDLSIKDEHSQLNEVNLEWLLTMYLDAPNKETFFLKSGFFNKLAGNDELMKQIKAGKSAKEIRDTWQADLMEFKQLRKKYLLYEELK